MKYFSLRELSRSATADRKGIDNTPPASAVGNLTALVDKVLDPLREWYGKPVTVNSGYRSSELNRAVGGVTSSQHLTGQAADIDTHSKSENRKLFDYIAENLDFDQLIWENGGAWVHVSYRADGKNRRQILKIRKK